MGIKDYWKSISGEGLGGVNFPPQEEIRRQYYRSGGIRDSLDWRLYVRKIVTADMFNKINSKVYSEKPSENYASNSDEEITPPSADVWDTDFKPLNLPSENMVRRQMERYGLGDDGLRLYLGRYIAKKEFEEYREAVLSRLFR